MGYSGSASERLAFVRARMEESMIALRYKVGREREVERQNIKDYERLELRLMDEVNSESGGDSMTSIGVYGGPT